MWKEFSARRVSRSHRSKKHISLQLLPPLIPATAPQLTDSATPASTLYTHACALLTRARPFRRASARNTCAHLHALLALRIRITNCTRYRSRRLRMLTFTACAAGAVSAAAVHSTPHNLTSHRRAAHILAPRSRTTAPPSARRAAGRGLRVSAGGVDPESLAILQQRLGQRIQLEGAGKTRNPETLKS